MIYTKKCADNWCINAVPLTVWQVCLKYLSFRLSLSFSLIGSTKWQFWKKININNFYVYHQNTIWQICINWLNGNLVVHMKIVNIYLLFEIDQIAIWWTTNLPNFHSADYTQTQIQTWTIQNTRLANLRRLLVTKSTLASETKQLAIFYTK